MALTRPQRHYCLTTSNESVTYRRMDAVAQALADPIRRDLLRMLGLRNHTAGELAGAFSVSRPAVSRHLRVLRDAGLVRDSMRGRTREYQLVVAALDELEAYLQALRAPAIDWERRFAALETEVFRVRNQRRGAARPAVALPTTQTKPKQESA
jgi:DNA-binding transcriptional ArsR family regulator